jgi:hypothetical protein
MGRLEGEARRERVLTSSIKRVHVLLARSRLLLDAVPDLEFAGLVVCAV